MLDKLLKPILDPIYQAWAKFMGVKNVADNLAGDKKRLKNIAGDVKKRADDVKKGAADMAKKAKGAAGAAKDAAGKAQGYMGQAQGVAGQAQGYIGGPGGAPPPGMPPQPGMPMQPGMSMQPGMPMPMQPGMPMQPMGGMPMGGRPQQMMGMGPPGPGVRTMALVAGGSSGAAIGWLVPLKGPSRGELITLKPSSTVGKDPTCDVCFNDPFMSGRHATIRAQNGLFVLEDHSTNGTFVNDRRVQRHELVDNDFVKFGQTMVKFKAL